MYADQASQSVRTRGASKHFESADLHMLLCRRAFLYYVLLPCLKYSPLPFQHIALQERAQSLLEIINGKPDPASDRYAVPPKFRVLSTESMFNSVIALQAGRRSKFAGSYRCLQTCAVHLRAHRWRRHQVKGPGPCWWRAGKSLVSSTVGCLATHTRNSHNMFMYIYSEIWLQ